MNIFRVTFFFIFWAQVVLAELIDPQHELLVAVRAENPTHILEMIGNNNLLLKRASPASTIKIPLALAGLEEKAIDLKSTFLCSDRTPQPSPMNLKQAMELSSNEFFEQLVKNLGVKRTESHLKSWGFSLNSKEASPSPMARGKAFLLSPQDEIRFLAQLVCRQLEGVSRPTYDLLDKALVQAEKPGLYGKTGSDCDGSWFVAYSRKSPISFAYVLRSDIPNSDGKKLKKCLIQYLELIREKSESKN